MKEMRKRGQMGVGGIYPFVLTLVLVGVVIGIGLYVLAQVETNIGGTAGEKINDTIVAIGNIPTWLTIIVVVAMAAIVLALIMGAFGGTAQR